MTLSQQNLKSTTEQTGATLFHRPPTLRQAPRFLTAVYKAVRRMKLRYREILPSEIASTVDSVNEVDDELRQLMRILSDS